MSVELAIRVNGKVKWVEVDPHMLEGIMGMSDEPLPTLANDEDFETWWNLYDKKTTKKQTVTYWKKHVTKKIYKKILEHTKKYILARPKNYRLDPYRYLNRNTWEDEVVAEEEKIDLDLLYPFDKTGNSRLGRCSKCNSVVFGNKFTIANDDSLCCKVKINKYR